MNVCRFGGIYIDMDMIVLKPLDSLHNTVGSEITASGELRLNGAILIFDKSRLGCRHLLFWCDRILLKRLTMIAQFQSVNLIHRIAHNQNSLDTLYVS